LSLSPSHAQSLAYLGDIELKRNHFDTAASLLGKSILQRKDIRIAYLDLGAVRAQQKQYPAAIKAFERAVELDPTQPDAHYRLGRVYQKIGQAERAKAEFAKTRELHRNSDAAVILQLGSPNPSP
jgi:tetratricopeptide (TPR) repeat protein